MLLQHTSSTPDTNLAYKATQHKAEQKLRTALPTSPEGRQLLSFSLSTDMSCEIIRAGNNQVKGFLPSHCLPAYLGCTSDVMTCNVNRTPAVPHVGHQRAARLRPHHRPSMRTQSKYANESACVCSRNHTSKEEAAIQS